MLNQRLYVTKYSLLVSGQFPKYFHLWDFACCVTDFGLGGGSRGIIPPLSRVSITRIKRSGLTLCNIIYLDI